MLIQTSFSSIRDVFSKVREGKSELEVLYEKKEWGRSRNEKERNKTRAFKQLEYILLKHLGGVGTLLR